MSRIDGHVYSSALLADLDDFMMGTALGVSRQTKELPIMRNPKNGDEYCDRLNHLSDLLEDVVVFAKASERRLNMMKKFSVPYLSAIKVDDDEAPSPTS